MIVMQALDLFCGLGGWSDGLAMEGFDVLGVEIEEKIARLYKHPSLVIDVRNLPGKMFRTFDLIVGSPPCRDFSVTTYFGKKKWKDKPNIERGLSMVHAFLRIVEEANPQFWVMENVPRLQEFLDLEPQATILMETPQMKRTLWGEFPKCIFPYQTGIKKVDVKGKYRSWLRAKIPLPVARALGKAVKEALK